MELFLLKFQKLRLQGTTDPRSYRTQLLLKFKEQRSQKYRNKFFFFNRRRWPIQNRKACKHSKINEKSTFDITMFYGLMSR